MEKINRKYYPMWSGFIKNKNKFIGKILQDFNDEAESIMLGYDSAKTKITDIRLRPNGDESAFFEVCGESFNCGFDVKYGGISGDGEEGWITFCGFGGHKWRIESAT